MKPSVSRQTGTVLLVVAVVLLLVQFLLWAGGEGWVAVRTGSVFAPVTSLLGLDHLLASHSMRGLALMADWLSRTHLYLLCLVGGIFLTSMDARQHD